MKSVYQKNPINLTSGWNNEPVGNSKSELVSSELSKYFHLVAIGKKGNGRYSSVTATVPVILLFTNKAYRDQFLAFTADSTDESVIRLRNCLANDSLRKKNYVLMVESIGNIVKKHGLKEYEVTTCTYTFENYLQGGEKIRYYINTDGIVSVDPAVKDLTGVYKYMMDYRAKGNQVSAEVQNSQQKRA